MNCCQCQGVEETFSENYVHHEVKEYHRRGPIRTTRILIEALSSAGVKGASLLDVGGGVGAIQHALLEAGAAAATDVDASASYLAAARAEAESRGLSGRIQFRHGNFVDLAGDISPAEVVTLDRVICCYDDMEKLVSLSSRLAGRLYGVVYPRDTWWTRLGVWIGNLILRLQRSHFRSYVHPTRAVEALIRANGLTRRFHRNTFIWQVAVFSR